MRTTRRTVAATALAASALAGAGVGVGTYAALNHDGGTTTVRQVAAPSSSSQQVSSADALSVAKIYGLASRGVVEISVTTPSSGSTFPFGQGGTQSAQGSGFVYDTAGHVITNDHVVAGATTISVRFDGGATYKAKVVGTDPSTDLAVLKIDAPSSLLHPLTLGDSGALQVGDGVVAIGSPFG